MSKQEITDSISDSLFVGLSEFLSSHMGLRFTRDRHRLHKGISAVARELGFGNTVSYINELMSCSLTKKQIEMLARRLTVGETYFFRHPDVFDILKEQFLPKLIDSRRGSDQRLRIWSAGCASGEEPYSLAILLSELIPDLKDWDVDLVATDINPRVLQKGSAGVYTEWSFRGTPLWTRHRYFTKTKEGYEILPEIKKMVRFTYHNLG